MAASFGEALWCTHFNKANSQLLELSSALWDYVGNLTQDVIPASLGNLHPGDTQQFQKTQVTTRSMCMPVNKKIPLRPDLPSWFVAQKLHGWVWGHSFKEMTLHVVTATVTLVSKTVEQGKLAPFKEY